MTPRAAAGESAPARTDAIASVVIICYNHGRFLGEAIESALGQTLPGVEVVVVDDGSTDDTPEVAARYPAVRYVRQVNQGMSAARNTGLRASRGRFVAFLDADDRLLPDGLRAGVECLDRNPQAAFVSGRHRMMSADGTPLPTEPAPLVLTDHYRTLLERNYIGMHATVLFRREDLEAVGGFDRSLRACDDYDVYLRIARSRPAACHEGLVAEYRWHGANTSLNSRLMIRSTLGPLRAQRPYVRGNPDLEAAYRSGIRHWQRYYGNPLLAQTLEDLRAPRRWGAAVLGLASLLRNYPGGLFEQALRRVNPAAARRRASAPRS